ncbi:hypothetical protein [Streptomyces tibetensis]|uniref:Uncharacterized protein n=1 Tax=Streptomyces tibetensis TaxID=2382123 RepID=A0ABW6MTN7_9ACTN
MALERTSHPGVTDFPDKANSLAPEALTAEDRLSQLAGARVGD